MGEADGPRPGHDPVALWHERNRALSSLGGEIRQALTRPPDVEESVLLTQRLAALLWGFFEDQTLWDALGRHRASLEDLDDRQRIALQASVSIDWAPLLIDAGYIPPPPASSLADELRIDVKDALSHPGAVDLDDLRQRVSLVATGLDHVLASERLSKGGPIRAVLQAVLSTATRTAVVNGAAAAAAAGTTAVTAPVLGPGAPVLGAVTGATVKSLDRVLPHRDAPLSRTGSAEDIRMLLHDRLRADQIGRQRTDLELIRAVAAERPGATIADLASDERLDGVVIAAVIKWVDYTLAAVFAAWEVAEEASLELLQLHLERASYELGSIRSALAEIPLNLDRLEEMTQWLVDDLGEIDRKLAGHHH